MQKTSKRDRKATRAVAWALALASVAVGVVVMPGTAEARNEKRSRTLHVEVNESGGDRVSISVPMGFATAALRIAGTVDLELQDEDIRMEDLRDAWSELRESGESVVLDVKDGSDTVHITNTRGMVRVDVDGEGESVKIAVPEQAVDALLSGEGNKLDLAGALGALEAGHVGNIVDIQDGGDHVRIWID